MEKSRFFHIVLITYKTIVFSFEGGDGTKVYSKGKLISHEERKAGEAVVGGYFYKVSSIFLLMSHIIPKKCQYTNQVNIDIDMKLLNKRNRFCDDRSMMSILCQNKTSSSAE